MTDLLLEKGADPFAGRIFIMGKSFSPFELAMKRKQIQMVNGFMDWAIKTDKNRTIEMSTGKIPLLHYFILKRFTGFAIKLVNEGVNLEAEESSNHIIKASLNAFRNPVQGRQALHIAAEMNASDSLIKLMLEKGANPFEGKMLITSGGRAYFFSPMDYAVLMGKWAFVNEVFDHSSENCIHHQVKTITGSYPLLYFLIEKGQTELVKKMVLAGADVNQRVQFGAKTPLHLAVQYGKSDLVEVMITKGVNPFQEKMWMGAKEYSPFEWALKLKDLKMANLILDMAEKQGLSFKPLKGFKIELEDGVTPILTYLLAQGHTKAVKELVLEGEDINQVDISNKTFWGSDLANPVKGRTPLHVAVKRKDEALVQLLLDRGANLEATINLGTFTRLTPLQLAKQNGFSDIEKMIKMYEIKEKNKMVKNREI
jgi:ankyrin repeat protein